MGVTAFIGGGNMAGALLGGLRRAGWASEALLVVEPDADRRRQLHEQFQVRTLAAPDASLEEADTVVWAVKPQLFLAAAAPAQPHVGRALQLSVMAGVRSVAIARASRSDRIVRAMPNTPALIGQGISALHAQSGVSAEERARAETMLHTTGQVVWVDRESDLDAVTALSGSGPAYVFYVLEAMVEAGMRLGLSETQARQLALATCAGASALASASTESLGVLRERVTSKGGTTAAALAVLDREGVAAAFVDAIGAARQRSQELGDTFGA